VKSILADSGPLVALYDGREPYHRRAIAAMRAAKPPVLTTWAVLTEATHLLPHHASARLLSSIENGALHVVELGDSGLSRTIELMRQYHDVPMDLADATIVALAEITGIRHVASIDFDDFETYRLGNGRPLLNVIERLF
jgi:uncharacterized protein